MQEIIAVYSEDQDFSENLCRKLTDRGKIPYELKAFTNKEDLQEFLRDHPRGAVLMDRQAADPEFLKMKTGRVLYLTDVKGYPVIDGVRTVFKYQALSGIEAELKKRVATSRRKAPAQSECSPKRQTRPGTKMSKLELLMVECGLLCLLV